MPPRSTTGLVRDRVVDNIDLCEPLRSVLNSTADRWESLAGLLDDFARVINDAPAPPITIFRSRNCCDLHRAYHRLRRWPPLSREPPPRPAGFACSTFSIRPSSS